MLVMLIIWILFIIGCGIYFLMEYEGFLFGAFVGMVIGIIPSLFIGGFLSLLLLGPAPMECRYTQDLVAMKDNTSISGSFFLGTGRIDSDMCYVYLVETDRGMITKTIKQETNKVYINYTDGQPYMEYWDGKDDPWRFAEEQSYYIFYLPEGSVINTFEIDLE